MDQGWVQLRLREEGGVTNLRRKFLRRRVSIGKFCVHFRLARKRHNVTLTRNRSCEVVYVRICP
jgi:hypothetical protein